MTQLLLNIEDNKYESFRDFIDTLDYVEVDELKAEDIYSKPFTEKELLARVAESETDYANGNTISQKDLESESNKW